MLPQAPAKPDFPDTSIAYFAGTGALSNRNQAISLGGLSTSRCRRLENIPQTLAIRLMPYSDRDPLPDWYRNSGAGRANKPDDKDGNIWQPDFSDPLYLKIGRLLRSRQTIRW